jgi:cell division protein ZapA (FtsZ GTPase activity inhibitor)
MAPISLKIRILDKEYQVNCQPEEREALEYSAQLLNEKMERFVVDHILLVLSALLSWPRLI